MSNFNNPNQQNSGQAQIIDRGRIVAVVDKYPEKVNGQVVMNQYNQPKMKNKWMAIGEATKFRQSDGSISEQRKIYLQPVSVLDSHFEEKTFWDSENQQQSGFNQSQNQSQNQNGFAPQQQANNGYQNSNGFNGQQQR